MAAASAEIRGSGSTARPASGRRFAIKSAGSTIEGTFDTIDEQGCMIVRTGAGQLVPITAGDVYFGSAASAGAT